jgi:hypothetical protein
MMVVSYNNYIQECMMRVICERYYKVDVHIDLAELNIM